MYKIGFIGLGIMGKPMARNLMKAGYKPVVYDINEAAVSELVKDGAEAGKSSSDVASKSEVIITMLPNSPEVREVVLGKNGIIDGVRSGSVVIDMSSIAPGTSKKVAEKLLKKGVIMLDAPVSGGEPKAIQGTLAIMVGGPEETFNKVKDILGTMGSSVTRVGEIGSGNITKLANQIIVAVNIAAIGEAMVLATKAGVDPEKVYNAIRGGLAGSIALDAKMPMVLDGNFKPGFKIALQRKDLKNALEVARDMNVPLPLTSLVQQELIALTNEGEENNDHSAICHFIERLAKAEIRRGSAKQSQ
jgi:2-hydroxy-3-oxopropionate reductase